MNEKITDIIAMKIKEKNGIFKNSEIVKSVNEYIEKNQIDYNIKSPISRLVGVVINDMKKEGILYKRKEDSINFLIRSKYNKDIKLDINMIDVSKFKRYEKIIAKINKCDFTNEEIKKHFILSESISSANIEGSQISIYDWNTKKDDNNDPEVIEIKNMEKIIIELNNIEEKLTIDSLKDIHKNLFKGLNNSGRYHSQDNLGNFKNKQNFISNGFLPASEEVVCEEMDKWLKEYNITPKNVSEAIYKSSYLHYWFEVIHPFADGNGRIGRILITNYFKQHQITKDMTINLSPDLIISDLYKRKLFESTIKNDVSIFINFMNNIAFDSWSYRIEDKINELENKKENSK